MNKFCSSPQLCVSKMRSCRLGVSGFFLLGVFVLLGNWLYFIKSGKDKGVDILISMALYSHVVFFEELEEFFLFRR